MTISVDRTGIHASDYEEILSSLQESYRSIYGSDVYLGNDSQDGQMLAVFAQAISDAGAAAVAVYNAFSPATAQGAGLSSVIKINGLQRNVSTFTTVDVTLIGQSGTVIANGVVSDGTNKFDLPSSVTIPDAGEITVTATAQELGSLTASIGTVTDIETPTRGWQEATNPTAAVPGNAVESDATLRVRQGQSTALAALSLFDATVAAVENLSGVVEVAAYENDTSETDDNGLPSHSISLVVLGGDSQAIAETIADKKNPGTGTYGTTSEFVVNASGAPLTVYFYRPTDVPITVEIDVTKLSGYVSTTKAVIQQAIVDYINGLPIGATPSQSVQWSKLFSAANDTAFGSTYNVTSIELKRDADALAPADVDIAFDENATCVVDDVTVNES